MPAFFANPLGLLALLAVPAILAIHFLREKSRRVSVSTLFLLEQLAPRTPRGRKLHTLQNTLPLWLQLLIALLCTWLLADPRWVRADSVQHVTIILDSSASMSAFRGKVRATLPGVLGELSRAAGRTDWAVLTTEHPATPLFRGTDSPSVLAAAESWQPALPHHDPARAFSLALLDARGGGTTLFVTDRVPASLPAGIAVLAVGDPLENCGFAGVRTWVDAGGAHWEALVKNSGATLQEREWWIEGERTRSQRQKLRLAPGETATVPGPFPAGEKWVRMRLSGDVFSLDDDLPLVVPEPKPLTVSATAPEGTAHFVERVIPTVVGARRAAAGTVADVAVLPVSEMATVPVSQWAMLFGTGAGAEAKAMLGAIVAERHRFTDGLTWEGLLSPGPGSLEREPTDEVLVWQRDQPLIFLRSKGKARLLVLNFNFEKSNAARLPAFVLLLGRFLTEAQAAKPDRFAENFETYQALPVAAVGSVVLETESGPGRVDAPGLRAPLAPGFFAVRTAEGAAMLEGAAHFGDPREADFRDAQTITSGLDRAESIRRANTVGDRFASLWLALIGAALAGSWAAQRTIRRAQR